MRADLSRVRRQYFSKQSLLFAAGAVVRHGLADGIPTLTSEDEGGVGRVPAGKRS